MTRTINITHNDKDYKGTVQRINATHLGPHSEYLFFEASLGFEGSGFGQAASLVLDRPPLKGLTGRRQSAVGPALLLAILDTVGANGWEDLKGREVITLRSDYYIEGIAHLTDEDKVLIFNDFVKERLAQEDAA